MGMLSRSFRLERGPSMRIGRTNSSILVSELVSSQIAKFPGYERLSDSDSNMTPIDKRGSFHSAWRKNRSWSFLSKVFSFRKTGGDHFRIRRRPEESAPKTLQAAVAVTGDEKRKKKRRSSWLPDPQRRWPVQGW